MQDLRLVVLEGGSGTGKSSLASALQERLLPQQWLHFSTDTVLYCLPQSILDKANLQNDWTSIDTRAISRSAHACVGSLLMSGYRVIFDCVIMTERGARELLLALQAHRPVLVRLTCTWEETRRRTAARGDRTLEEAEHGFKTSGLHLVADHVIDTTNRTPGELADSVAS
jgi:chloramphenicol 3-O phosphotransferase